MAKYGYLDGLSEKTRNYLIDRIEGGEKNLYLIFYRMIRDYPVHEDTTPEIIGRAGEDLFYYDRGQRRYNTAGHEEEVHELFYFIADRIFERSREKAQEGRIRRS